MNKRDIKKMKTNTKTKMKMKKSKPIKTKIKIKSISKVKPKNTDKIVKAKTNDTKLQRRIIEFLPAIQSDIWKTLKIERRKTSELINSMIKSGLIRKTKVKGSFMVELNEKVTKKECVSPLGLLSKKGNFSPCCGCILECVPTICVKLDKWVRE